ncbi:hypothetical protein Pmani_009758 [Petrolisthes manimaculis]|uniref:Retinol dehydrogenase 11 n=1 Tax=Petrolisthes manimaculis TaxID=1843537 RepID=A0AAE1Q3J0_9EUCA|nr:hypothetical protein Pmani_009758 [Petrolisthes manimaculis]
MDSGRLLLLLYFRSCDTLQDSGRLLLLYFRSCPLETQTKMWETVVMVTLATVCAVTIIMCVFGHVYRLRSRKVFSTASMQGKTVIITGASAGIGKATAFDLAQRKARLILACRNIKKASYVAAEIQSSTGNSAVEVRQLDTSSLASVRAFASRILAEEHRIDVLVLNAGIGGKNVRTLTSEGLETIMATNHFGHFLLTNLLLGLLKESAPSRIVVTASMAHTLLTSLNLKELNFENAKYWSLQAYAQSKLCNILFARYLAHLLKDTGVVVNSLCPGFVATEIFEKAEGFAVKLYGFLAQYVGKTCEQGAQTIIQLTVAEETQNITGEFFENCQVSDGVTNLAIDDGLAKKVWEASELLVGLDPTEQHY